MRIFFFALLLCTAITGCQHTDSSQTANSPIGNSSTEKGLQKEDIHEALRPFVEASTSDPTSYVNDLRYTLQDLREIQMVAKKHGIENPFIPTEGIATDDVVSVDEETDTLKITYPHFSLRQSRKEITPDSGNAERIVKSDRGEFNWVYADDTPLLLFTVRDGITISISSAKPFETKEFETVMESLVPLFDHELENEDVEKGASPTIG
ncbi:hypothetical protein NDK47_04460 [Brevibacillus ruminantium]|uniref:DUF4367 domain-containing protein n=1 Tax=Brevibacillus ruminantium TaxID=2950604 RepID=A0ABY4WHM0_9BACL|nr:hypothetical protein [Brevibacillus ruminantium]USG66558.1 hypothetical protein NDK47_04460 [Brevibacillus ruminantium]